MAAAFSAAAAAASATAGGVGHTASSSRPAASSRTRNKFYQARGAAAAPPHALRRPRNLDPLLTSSYHTFPSWPAPRASLASGGRANLAGRKRVIGGGRAAARRAAQFLLHGLPTASTHPTNSLHARLVATSASSHAPPHICAGGFLSPPASPGGNRRLETPPKMPPVDAADQQVWPRPPAAGARASSAHRAAVGALVALPTGRRPALLPALRASPSE